MVAMRTLAFLLLSPFSNGFSISTTKIRPQRNLSLKASNANELVPLRKGSSVAIVTPMKPETGEIDFPALRNLLRYHVSEGTDNLCILGTTGEASVMTMEERASVLKTAVSEVKGKMPILAGTGTINPAKVKEMTMQAMDLGCDAALVVTPYYVKPPQRSLIRHFTEIADLGLPVMIYNVPGRTGSNMLDDNIVLAAQHENIVALKDATADLSRVETVRSSAPANFLLYSGDDGTTADFVLKGGDGCISVTANVAAKAVHDMVHAALEGKAEEAYDIESKLDMLNTRLFVESNPIPAKWAVKRVGLTDSAYCRPPLDEMDPKFESQVEEALRAAGLIDAEMDKAKWESKAKQDAILEAVMDAERVASSERQ